MSDVATLELHGDLCISVAVVVTDGNAGIIDAYAADMSDTLARSFRYFELLLVDNTGLGEVAGRLEDLLKQLPNVRLLKLSKRYAEEIAFTAALDHSIGDFVVLMDPDTDPTALVPVFVHRCADGLDAVVGSYDRRKEQGRLGQWGAAVFYRLLRAMTGYTIEPNTSHFCVLSRRVVNAITRIKDKERYLKYLTAYVGYKHGTIAYERIHRGATSTPRGFWASVWFGIDMIVTYSDKPLRLLSLAGVLASFISLLYIVFVLLIAFFKDAVGLSAAEGWASTNAFNAAMFFLLFSMLAVLSEYVLKVLNEAQQRPLYHVAYESNSVVLEEQRGRVNVV
jgi:polyisoprenyl-phosphate glycosyltransferase